METPCCGPQKYVFRYFRWFRWVLTIRHCRGGFCISSHSFFLLILPMLAMYCMYWLKYFVLYDVYVHHIHLSTFLFEIISSDGCAKTHFILQSPFLVRTCDRKKKNESTPKRRRIKRFTEQCRKHSFFLLLLFGCFPYFDFLFFAIF